ncbi:hypothetical protein BH10ACT7_BH10ACT7_03000 [soil metagenome]
MTLPYPLPEAWKLQDAPLVRRWPAFFWAVVAIALAVLMIAAAIRGDVGWGILFSALFGAVGAGLGVSYERAGAERGLPLLINAVVLTRARVRPPDSWIHFFREAGPRLWLTVCFVSTGTLTSISLIATVVTIAREGGAALWWLVLVIPLGLGALVLALAGWIAVVQVLRHTSFGRRPIGISLGRHGLIRYYLDDVDVWPWESIARVKATGKQIDPENGDFTANLVIVPVEQPADVTQDEYVIWGYQSHPWLIYTAVRFWAEHPELRSELGTTYGQRRIEAWRDAMLARPSGSGSKTSTRTRRNARPPVMRGDTTVSQQIRILTDRDSVAMGDDAVSHQREFSVDVGTPLSVVLGTAAPEIRSPGWSWVAVWNGEEVAVWSVDHGVRLLVEERQLGPADDNGAVMFRYFLQLDPEWLHGRLSAGAPLDRKALEAEFEPIARERRESELRRREREVEEKFLSPECLEALAHLGAVVDLHADLYCRFDVADERWVVSRADTMMLVLRGDDPFPVASIRPHSAGEGWLVAAVAGSVRGSRGLTRFPSYEQHPLPEIRPMGSFPAGRPRWTTVGPLTAQVSGDESLECLRFAHGRSIAQIVSESSV